MKTIAITLLAAVAFAEPEAKPKADADPYLLYGGYGGYGLGHLGYGGYYGHGLGHLGYYRTLPSVWCIWRTPGLWTPGLWWILWTWSRIFLFWSWIPWSWIQILWKAFR